jgi:hypothetical protein
MIQGRLADERLYFCSHCEEELFIEPYLAHIYACIGRHMANWPVHAYGASDCPELCGKPHRGERREELRMPVLRGEVRMRIALRQP